eukprot:gene26818-biopygen17407
MSRGGCSRL